MAPPPWPVSTPSPSSSYYWTPETLNGRLGHDKGYSSDRGSPASEECEKIASCESLGLVLFGVSWVSSWWLLLRASSGWVEMTSQVRVITSKVQFVGTCICPHMYCSCCSKVVLYPDTSQIHWSTKDDHKTEQVILCWAQVWHNPTPCCLFCTL